MANAAPALYLDSLKWPPGNFLQGLVPPVNQRSLGQDPRGRATQDDLDRKVPIFRVSQSPGPPCLVFASLFDVFVFSRRIARARPPMPCFVGKNRPKNNRTLHKKRPRVERLADHAPQRVPARRVEPVPELHETALGELLGGAVVEVWVELVDHRLVPDHREKPDQERREEDRAQREVLQLGWNVESCECACFPGNFGR